MLDSGEWVRSLRGGGGGALLARGQPQVRSVVGLGRQLAGRRGFIAGQELRSQSVLTLVHSSSCHPSGRRNSGRLFLRPVNPMSNLSSSASRSLRRTRLQSLAFDLTKRCPALGGNPGDCPLFGVRQLTPARRRRWLEGLTDEDLRYLSLYHQLCYQELGAGRAG